MVMVSFLFLESSGDVPDELVPSLEASALGKEFWLRDSNQVRDGTKISVPRVKGFCP